MSDNIPLEIQMEIIKKVYDVKSLIRFRSVSKPWKSFIDSSEFIKGYGARHTQPHSRILSLSLSLLGDGRFICLVDDDNYETFKVLQQEFAPFVMSPLLKRFGVFDVVGGCHGLLCLSCYNKDDCNKKMVIIWNPSIGKSFGIDIETLNRTVFGFGVCPVTSDPTVIVICGVNMPWHVEVFTLSSGVWNVIPSANLPRLSIELDNSTHVVIDRFIYWGARDIANDGVPHYKYIVVSFDLITKEFKVVDLPDTLTNSLTKQGVSVSKLRESLVVYGYKVRGAGGGCDVWVMEHDSSFRKLFTIGTRVCKILGFSKSCEAVFEIEKNVEPFISTLDVYDSCSQQIKNLGISGASGSFFMGSYKESLLLLDQPDLHIYSNIN